MSPVRLSSGGQRGLTLIELLLTFLIFSLVIAIFSQAVFQISLFARSSARTTSMWQQRWATGFALDDYFSGLVVHGAGTDNLAAIGGPDQFATWWVERAGEEAGLPIRVRLSLRSLGGDGRDGRWGMYLDRGDATDELAARWEYRVSFRYIDSKGSMFTAWPPPLQRARGVQDEALPRAVWVVDDRGAIAHAWHFGGLTQPNLAQRRNAFGPSSSLAMP